MKPLDHPNQLEPLPPWNPRNRYPNNTTQRRKFLPRGKDLKALSLIQHGRKESNLQPPVLETGALPIELRPYNQFALTRPTWILDHHLKTYELYGVCPSCPGNTGEGKDAGAACRQPRPGSVACYQARILVTTPEPTVRPPSRMAKRRPSSMAMGLSGSSSTVNFTLSPGMHISTPSGSLILPVTSVVRK